MTPTLKAVTTVGVWGPVSSGKTYLLNQWVRSMGRVLFLDVTGSTISDDSFAHVWQNPRAMAEYLRDHPNYHRVAYHPGGDVQADFQWCQRAAWMLNAPRWLVVDELWQIAPVREALLPEMNLIARLARHVKLGFVGASQRVQDVSNILRSGTRMNVFFYMEQRRELDAVAETWGDAVADAVAELRPCLYDDEHERVLQIPECLVAVKGKPPVIYDLGSEPVENEPNKVIENEPEPAYTGTANNVEETPEEETPTA